MAKWTLQLHVDQLIDLLKHLSILESEPEINQGDE